MRRLTAKLGDGAAVTADMPEGVTFAVPCEEVEVTETDERGAGEMYPAHPEGVEPPLPGLGRTIGNALGAVARTAGAVAYGKPIKATPEVVAARLSVCREGVGLGPDQMRDGHCDRYRVADGRCSACGCLTRLKSVLALERCPLGRWAE